MTKAYPDYQLPVILDFGMQATDFGMQATVEGRSYPEIMRAFLSQDS